MIVIDWFPLALDGGERHAVLLHEFAHAAAQEHGTATHAEVRVEVRDAHGLCLALEEGEVVGLEQRGEELGEYALLAARLVVWVQARAVQAAISLVHGPGHAVAGETGVWARVYGVAQPWDDLGGRRAHEGVCAFWIECVCIRQCECQE